MKIAKYILLLILLFGVALTVFIATQPSYFQISKERKVAATPQNAYQYISNYENWKEWFLYLNEDSLNITIKDNANLGMQWQTKTDSFSLKNIHLVLNDSINQEFKLNDTKNQLSWKFKSEKDSTLITWKVAGNLSLKEKFSTFFFGGLEALFGSQMNKNLDKIAQNLSNDYSKHQIVINGFVTKHGTNYIHITDSCSIKDFDKVRQKDLLSLLSFAKENQIKPSGSSFTIFKKWNEKDNFTVFSVCVPINFEIVTSSNNEIKGGTLESFLALKTTLNGSLEFRKNAWDKAFDHILKEQYTQNEEGAYIEVYKAINVAKPSDIQTEIYIPVRKLVAEENSSEEVTTEASPDTLQ